MAYVPGASSDKVVSAFPDKLDLEKLEEFVMVAQVVAQAIKECMTIE